jgi:Cof subfamily protein (haloacid dehalogenase superfamily)
MVKMIIIDLDGTLLADDKNISDYNVSILEKCKKGGIKIAFATARSEKACKRITDLINPNILILNDGALIIDENKQIMHRKVLSKKTTDGIIKDCINDNNVGVITVETDENYYVAYKKAFHPDYDHGIYYDFSKKLSKESYKISVEIFTEETALNIRNKFKECKLTYNFGENWYRFSHKDVDKMNAINIIAKYQNILLSDIVAFGDDYNDIEMIKRCGIGVAMENGIKEIKEDAKYICEKNNEDGVGKWIEDNIIKETHCA